MVFHRRSCAALTVACLLACAPAAGAAEPAAGSSIVLRGLRWGATAGDIEQHEGGPSSEATNSGANTILVYHGTLVGEPVSVVYRLIQGRLFQIDYHIEARGRTCDQLHERYDQMVSAVTSELGTPSPATQGTKPCNATTEWASSETMTSVNLTNDSRRVDLSLSSVSANLSGLATSVTTTSNPAR